MTKTVRFHQTGDPEVLRIEDQELRAPGKGEVAIKVRAVGLNRAESMFRRGQYLETPKLPSGLGYEASGTIELLGPGVEGFSIGDAVSGRPKRLGDRRIEREHDLSPGLATCEFGISGV